MSVVPGLVMLITPPQLQIHFDVCDNAGLFAINTVGEPGAHGAEITGIHGIGVSTPIAADVAAATCGFAIELHIPNGIMFFIGTLSIIVATGILDNTLFSGVTIKVDGAIPNVQAHIAVPHTASAIFLPPHYVIVLI